MCSWTTGDISSLRCHESKDEAKKILPGMKLVSIYFLRYQIYRLNITQEDMMSKKESNIEKITDHLMIFLLTQFLFSCFGTFFKLMPNFK